MSDTQSKIMEAIGMCKSEETRAMLILVHEGFFELGTKIDRMLSDEQTLRELVLNGSAAGHDDDHAWIKRFREREEELRNDKRLISRDVIKSVAIAALAIMGTLMVIGWKQSVGL